MGVQLEPGGVEQGLGPRDGVGRDAALLPRSGDGMRGMLNSSATGRAGPGAAGRRALAAVPYRGRHWLGAGLSFSASHLQVTGKCPHQPPSHAALPGQGRPEARPEERPAADAEPSESQT